MNLDLGKYWRILRSLFKTEHIDLAGLDINSDFIRVLKIDTTAKPCLVENLVIERLPLGMIVKDQIKNPEEIAERLRRIWRENQIKTKQVAIDIPRASAIIKNITVSSVLTMDEIESRVWLEAERHFSNLIGEIYLDFSILGPAASDPMKTDVVMVAARKDQLKPLLDVISMAGLEVKIVDVSSYTLERAISCVIPKEELKSQTIALLNIDYTLITLLVLDKGKFIYTNDQSYEGHSLMELKPKVELVVESTGDGATPATTTDPAEEALQTTFSPYLRHIMQYFYSSQRNLYINQVILSGDCASNPLLFEFIKKEIGANVVLANPFQHMAVAPTVSAENLNKQAPSLMLSCGLAMSELK